MTPSSPPADRRIRNDRRARGLPTALVLVLFVATATRASGVTPPRLAPPTYASEMLAVLGEELDHFAQVERGADPAQRVIVRASINLRIIAAELLERGSAAGVEGSVAVLRGFQVAHGRAAFDEMLIGVHRASIDPDADGDRGAAAAVARFNDVAVDRAASLRTIDAGALDRALPVVFGPLAEAATLVTGTPVTSHWPRAVAVVAPAPAPAPAAPPSIDELAARTAGAPVGAGTRAALDEILDFLRRGERFPELASAVDDGRAFVARLLDVADVVAAATLLDDTARGVVLDRLHAALAAYRAPDRRDDGHTALVRLERLASVLRTGATLPDARALDPLRGAVSAVAAGDNGGPAAARALDRLAAVVDRMAAFRELDVPPLPRELRAAWVRVRDRHERAERDLLDDLGRLADDPLALADPAFVARFQVHRQTLADLRRLARVPGWRERMRAILPRAPGFQGQLRRWAQGLVDPHRREAAAGAMDRFDREITRYAALPIEADLAAATPTAIVATGGLHVELRRAIDAARRAWAEGWNRGAPDEASAWMDRLARLARAMADGAALLEEDRDALSLGRWAAWETHRGLLRRVEAELPNRLKLATAAAVADDAIALDAQLARLESEGPLPALVGRLTRRLEPALAACPGGVTGRLGTLVHPPPPDAWMGAQRREIAELCRHAIELESARSAGEPDATLAAFVDARARALLAALETAGAPRPPAERSAR